MRAVKTKQSDYTSGPSVLALLVDNISRMSISEQKLLWLQLNQNKLDTLAREMDACVLPHELSTSNIDALISEARKHGRKKKKG